VQRCLVNAAAVLALCLALSGCAAPAAPATPSATQTSVALKPFNVVLLGDSIAEGIGATTDSTRWWIRVQTALRAAVPERSIVFKNAAIAGTGLDDLERTAATVSPLAYQVAVIIEGGNDQVDDGAWLSRYGAVISGLETKGIVVVVGTYPPALRAGAFAPAGRNTLIRTFAGPKRPLLDFEQRWRQAGPTAAAAWYSDEVHANDAGQAIEAEIALAVFLVLART
jgi:lysophospholipase L1-like esterase